MKRTICLLLCLLLQSVFLYAAEPKAAGEEKAAQEKKKDKEAKEKVITLRFQPKEKVKETPQNIPPVKVFFDEVRDERPRPKEIGENLENKDKRISIVTAEENGAAQFVQGVLKEQFREKGFTVEENASGAQKILRGTLIKFWTVEERRYRSEVALKLEVRDKAHHLYYQRSYTGEGTNFGRSLSEANYQESISESLARMLDLIFADDALIKALAERPRPARSEEKASPSSTKAAPAQDKTASPAGKAKKPTGAKPTGPVFGPK